MFNNHYRFTGWIISKKFSQVTITVFNMYVQFKTTKHLYITLNVELVKHRKEWGSKFELSLLNIAETI